MAKVHPDDDQALSLPPYQTHERETFTIWMKSLVYHTNGCTVYNSNGDIVFRVDNYEKKCSNEVHLMDLHGKVLYTIRKKKLQAFGGWDGYRWSASNMNKEEKPWFQVKRDCKMLIMGDLACQITVGCDKYRIQKLSSSGVVLGDDVLSLEVEPHRDHSLIMALVMVYGLIRRKM
ncbi:hypothetical protein TIFTF001_003561 [Ficus carica]|uniref:Uncharacterized protein n=1 Tax=Ficus carica TaxID=3494 RepID=A0AA87ZE36_FICCA|nr:hypothetical protein TIFTF001_003561 [Ficus carica]